MTKRLGIFGFPLGHSLSPAMHGAALRLLGIDATFEAWPTPPDQLRTALKVMRQADHLGASVTLPHKQAVIPMMDTIDEWAREIGAVNCIANRGGKLFGFNTDAGGFIRALREEAAFDPAGSSVVLLGAGGAARGWLRLATGRCAAADRGEPHHGTRRSPGGRPPTGPVQARGMRDRSRLPGGRGAVRGPHRQRDVYRNAWRPGGVRKPSQRRPDLGPRSRLRYCLRPAGDSVPAGSRACRRPCSRRSFDARIPGRRSVQTLDRQ